MYSKIFEFSPSKILYCTVLQVWFLNHECLELVDFKIINNKTDIEMKCVQCGMGTIPKAYGLL